MSKKDRIAIVISLVYLLVLFIMGFKPEGMLLFGSPVILYWGYRLIQNDISFLRIKDDNQ